MAATVAGFKTAFPSFNVADTPSVEYYLDRALRVSTWGDDHATYLATAHYLTLNGIGVGAEAEMAAAGTLGFQRIKSGALELDRGTGSSDGFNATSYGKQFLPLYRANAGGPLVTGTGVPVLTSPYGAPWGF